MAVQPGLDLAPAVTDRVEHEHPPAAEAEGGAAAGVAVDGEQDPQPEGHQGDADDPAHDRVQPVREDRAEPQRREPEGDHDRAMAERVQRAEADRLDLVGAEPGRPDGGHRRHRGERRGAGAAVVRAHLRRAAMAVVVARDRPVLVAVGGLGAPGGGGRAGDVGDRRDVVPVDAVPHPEQQAGHEDADRGRIEQGRDGWLHGTDLRGRVNRTNSRPMMQLIASTQRKPGRITGASGDAPAAPHWPHVPARHQPADPDPPRRAAPLAVAVREAPRSPPPPARRRDGGDDAAGERHRARGAADRRAVPAGRGRGRQPALRARQPDDRPAGRPAHRLGGLPLDPGPGRQGRASVGDRRSPRTTSRGGTSSYRGRGLLARAFQHEIDHLAGRLYTDLVEPDEVVDAREHPDAASG